MPAGVVQPLNPLIWLGAPALACAAGSLLLTLPVEIAGVGLPQPVLAMIPAFAWAVIRPSLLAPFVLILVGLFQDLLWGDRLGLWPSALLAAYAIGVAARPLLAGQGFWTHWGWYLGALGAGFGVAVALTFFTVGQAPDPGGLAIQVIATAAVFWPAWRLIETYEGADVRFK
jgi:rod shape-determining protein MreD